MHLVLTELAQRYDDIDQNFNMLLAMAERHRAVVTDADIIVLPELIGALSDEQTYQQWVAKTAALLGCVVVGGSHHKFESGRLLNTGVVVDAQGNVLVQYDKQIPYGSENAKNVHPGNKLGYFEIYGARIVTWICSDLWFSESFRQLPVSPDLVLIPSFSISTVNTPLHARKLWQHMTVARAYEFDTYIGVSDWAHPCEYDGLKSSGVSGLATPRTDLIPQGRDFFIPVGDATFKMYRLDFDLLERLRNSKRKRGFYRAGEPSVLDLRGHSNSCHA